MVMTALRVILTGASSFTGSHFVRALSDAGHDVVATMTRASADEYEGVRRERVELVSKHAAEILWGASFGDEAFIEWIESAGMDVLCHHAADVTDYKSDDFDYRRALSTNTRNAKRVVEALASNGGRALVLTGSVFEGGEGAGSEGLPHFSPYGLSKALTSHAFAFECERAGLPMGKFVIPNPFGPLEEPRFTNYLMKSWFAGETPSVRTPAYVRDNIHVDLLAKSYASFVVEASSSEGFTKLNPCGYIESQGAFAERVAREMRTRLDMPCEVDLMEQTDFPEPRVRINTDAPDARALGFDESRAWDAFASFYAQKFAGAKS